MKGTRAALLAFAAAVVAAGALVACGGDDVSTTPPVGDAGTDAVVVHTDGAVDGNVPPGDGGTQDGGGDAGPCDFNAFVEDLVQNHTNSTEQPSVQIGDQCVDSHTAFPANFF